MSAALHAIESLTRKASRTSTLIGAPIILGACGLGVVLYLVLLELEAEWWGYVFLKTTMICSLGVSLAIGIPLAKWSSFAAIRARRKRWIEDAAREHQVHPNERSEALETWH